jgi:hypothetical protein
MRRVKHFAGYGCVEMGVVEKHQIHDTDGVKKTKMAVLVKGNHECGLVPNCARYGYYGDVIHWVFNRFEKKFNGEEDDIEVCYNEDPIEEGGKYVDVVRYTFIY